MARPIVKTPIIAGEDAQRFKQYMFRSLSLSFPPEEIERKKQELLEMKKFYQQFVAATNGTF